MQQIFPRIKREPLLPGFRDHEHGWPAHMFSENLTITSTTPSVGAFSTVFSSHRSSTADESLRPSPERPQWRVLVDLRGYGCIDIDCTALMSARA
jgi:hypothetical protein